MATQTTFKDYDDFIKNSTKTKKAKEGKSLSTYDNQYNRALWDQYVKEAALLEQKNTVLSENEQDKDVALREEAILTEKAKAYLGKQSALLGNSNSGVAQSNIVDMYVNAANNRAQIANTYDTKKSDILLKYDEAINDVALDTNKSLFDIETAADAQRESDRVEAASSLTTRLEEYEQGLTTYDDFLASYEQNKKLLDSTKDAGIISKYEKVIDEKEKITKLEDTGVKVNKLTKASDVNESTFGGWNVSATMNAAALAQTGKLDELTQRFGPIAIDMDGDSNTRLWVIYYDGYFYEVNTATNATVESKYPTYEINDSGELYGVLKSTAQKSKSQRDGISDLLF